MVCRSSLHLPTLLKVKYPLRLLDVSPHKLQQWIYGLPKSLLGHIEGLRGLLDAGGSALLLFAALAPTTEILPKASTPQLDRCFTQGNKHPRCDIEERQADSQALRWVAPLLRAYDQSTALSRVFCWRSTMDLCDTCKLYTLDRFLIEGSIRHGVFRDLIPNSKHCVLCRLILETVRRRIMETTLSTEDTDKHLEFLKTSQVSLRYPASQSTTVYRDRIQIDVREPSLMIDGWLVLNDSDSCLRMFREPG